MSTGTPGHALDHIVPTNIHALISEGSARLLHHEKFLRVQMTDVTGVVRRPRPFRVEDPFSSGNADTLLNDNGYIPALDLFCVELNDAILLGERAILLNETRQLMTDSHHPEHSVDVLAVDDRRQFERVPLRKVDDGYNFENPMPQMIEIDDPVILLSSMEENNYGAFLLRVATKLIQIGRLGLNETKVLVASRGAWQRTILKWAGIGEDRLIDHDAAYCYQARQMIVPSLRLPNFFLDDASVAFCQAIRERIAREHEVPTGASPLVYVSRRGQAIKNPTHRVMTNEAELIEMLERKGFCIFEPEAHSFEVQAMVFGQARMVVGPGGAGMFNTIFCRPGVTMISMEPQMDWLVMHANIFSSMGHQYGLVVGGSDPTDHSAQKRWRADLPSMARLIDAIV